MTKTDALKHIANLPDDAVLSVTRDWHQESLNELNKLKADIDKAFQSAFDNRIIDTMGNPTARGLLYVKNVCQNFVDKHKDLRMI